ncbi:uncharacterized protein LOC135696306 [Rhopilema esculentum]|uniref:uncharacterized protein LOC135696306 n=1 Tax=Rhopilema esculentum TaxID=499914 RepID=UPI0031E4062E
MKGNLEQNERKRNIIVSFTDKHGKYSNGRHKVYLAIEDIKEKVNFYLARDDAYKMLPVFIKEFEKRDVMKYINSIGLLREYDSYAITADNELTYIDEVHLFTSRERSQSYVDSRRGEIRYHTTEDKVRVVITLKSEEQVSGVKCSLECSSHGRCKEMPFSSARYCQCKPFYQGQKCEDKVKANLAKTMDAMLAKTLKLPMLSDIAYDIKDMREYVGVGIGALQAAVSELEEKFQRAYDKISHQLSSQFEWANLLTLYSSSLQNIKQYALRFETLPKRYADIMEEEGRKLATAVLAPNGIERWLTDVNFLLIGRSGVPLLKHKPMLILFMNKYKNQACLDSYKNAVSSAWKQLVLLQTIGFMVWAQALEFNDRGPHRIVNLYKQRTDLQMAKFKSTTCEYQVANSENIQCAGGRYLHPGLTIKNKCKPNYYATGELTTNCIKRGATCRPCGCNSRGSRSLQCSDTTGKCQCHNGFKGNKCNNRDCEW